MKTKSALSWYGSDSEVAPELAKMLDHCDHVTIPFCGGLAILPHLKARAIVANDLHDLAINFYKVASGVNGDPVVLRDLCQHTLSHPTELTEANCVLSEGSGSTLTAWAFWCQCWLGRKGKGGCTDQGGMPSVRRTASGGTNASRVRAAANDMEEWAKHFERCEWQQVDFRELLPKVADNPKCGVYVDSPWVGVGDKYLHEFSYKDHDDLASYLSGFNETTVVIRYGEGPLIRSLYSYWEIIEAESGR